MAGHLYQHPKARLQRTNLPRPLSHQPLAEYEPPQPERRIDTGVSTRTHRMAAPGGPLGIP